MTDREFLHFIEGYLTAKESLNSVETHYVLDKVLEHLGKKGKVEVNGLLSNLEKMAPHYTQQNGHVFQPTAYAAPSIGGF